MIKPAISPTAPAIASPLCSVNPSNKSGLSCIVRASPMAAPISISSADKMKSMQIQREMFKPLRDEKIRNRTKFLRLRSPMQLLTKKQWLVVA